MSVGPATPPDYAEANERDPDGSLSSAGASRAPALFPVCRWDLFDRLIQAVLGSQRRQSHGRGIPANPATLVVLELVRLLLPRVHAVDLLGVLLRDHLALDLEGGGDLAGLLVEGAGQEGEVLDRLPVAKVLVEGVDAARYQSDHARVANQVLGTSWDLPVDRKPVGDDEGCDVGPALADDDRLLDEIVALDLELELLGRHVLAARGLDQVLLAVGDLQEAIAVHLADVPGSNPTVVQHLGRRDRVVVVAQHVARAVHQDLAVLGELELDPGERLAHCKKAMLGESVRGGARGGLGHAPAVEDGDPDGPEELFDLAGQCRAAADEEAQAPPDQSLAQRAQHQALRDPVLSLEERPGARLVREPGADADRPTEQGTADPGRFADAIHDAGVHLLVHARHAEEDGRLHLRHVFGEVVHSVRKPYLSAKQEDCERAIDAFEHVRERKPRKREVGFAQGVHLDDGAGRVHQVAMGAVSYTHLTL